MRIRVFFCLAILPFFTVFRPSFGEEVINDLVAVVGDVPITLLDLQKELQFKDINQAKDRRNRESIALDRLIEKAIVDIVLKEEVISVPESQVDDIIKKTMEDNGIKDVNTFTQVLRQQMHLTMAQYRKEVLNSLKIQQISQLEVSVPAPTDEEIHSWYNKHRKDIGDKYLIRMIKKKFHKNDLKDELNVNKLMNAARGEAIRNFAVAAKKYSDDPTAAKGGLLGWVRLVEVYQMDPLIANVVSRLHSGDVSMVFPSKDSYYLIKVDDLKPISYEEASGFIAQRIYAEKQRDGFKDWMQERRKNTAITIYYKHYMPPKQ